MKRILFLSLLTCAALPAQTWSKGTFYVGGGFASPMSDFGERHDMGGTFLAGGGYQVTPQLSLNLEYTFLHHGYQFQPRPTVPGQAVVDFLDGRTEMHGFTFAPRYRTPPFKGIGTYVTGAYGIYNSKFQLTRPGVATGIYCDPYWYWCYEGLVGVDVLLGEQSTWKMGWNAGMGIEFGGRVKFFAEARYMWVATTRIRTETIPVTFGVRF